MMCSCSSPGASSPIPHWRYYEIDASHSPNVTAPEALVRLLDEIVR